MSKVEGRSALFIFSLLECLFILSKRVACIPWSTRFLNRLAFLLLVYWLTYCCFFLYILSCLLACFTACSSLCLLACWLLRLLPRLIISLPTFHVLAWVPDCLLAWLLSHLITSLSTFSCACLSACLIASSLDYFFIYFFFSCPCLSASGDCFDWSHPRSLCLPPNVRACSIASSPLCLPAWLRSRLIACVPAAWSVCTWLVHLLKCLHDRGGRRGGGGGKWTG